MKKFSINRKFRKGAASFYIVAISTLILVIIAASFAAVIVSEVTRTSNDDLSQSAYDSALAGVEDAKLAFYNYQDCKNKQVNGEGDPTVGAIKCSDLIRAIENNESYNENQDPNNCDLVARALNRDVVDANNQRVDLGNNNIDNAKGVLVQEGNSTGDGNQMQQYYTCVKISAITDDYLGELDSEDAEHSVRVRFQGENENGDVANSIDRVRLSWYSRDNSDGSNAAVSSNTWYDPMVPSSNGVFGTKKSTPPVVSLTMIQTDKTFNLSNFDMTTSDNATDRGTLYFVPVDSCSSSDNYICKSGNASSNDLITNSEGFAKSNDKTIKNKPFAVSCVKDWSQDYACSVLIEIPRPVNQSGTGAGSRNPETFVFSVALPYGEPKTDYSLEFLSGTTPVRLDGVQISIDSTGRANDLFRRVDTRLEPADAAYPYPIYGIEALDPNGNPGIVKNFDTTCEYNFDDQTCR